MTMIVIIFCIVYLGMMLGHLPYLKVNRAAIALVGAIVLIAWKFIGHKEAVSAVDFETLALLFGLMIISVQFEMSGLYDAVSNYIGTLKISPSFFLGLIIFITGGLSAFLTNDVIAMATTPVILSICINRKLNPIPFMLAIAFSANSGAIATFVGSPQNMLIAEALKISFITFLIFTAVPAILSLFIVWGVLVLFYRKSWELPKSSDCTKMRLPKTKFLRYEACFGLVIIVLVIGYFMFTNDNRGTVAAVAAAILLMNAHFKSQEMLERVDWNLLILFFGLFIVNAAIDTTGIPRHIVNALAASGFNLHEPKNLFITTAILSDIVSNVPGVMLLLPYATHAISGPLMAIASGLSSNLIIIGSLANIIVIDAVSSRGLKISFWTFSKSGIPICIISMIISVIWVYVARSLMV